MTRTARAAYPRAIIKDRSESRSGLDSSLRKQGAGQHNWGSLSDERALESEALDDDSFETEEVTKVPDNLSVSSESGISESKPEMQRSTSSLSEDEMQKARQFRKNAFKSNEIDLSAIARTSAAVSSSPPTDPSVRRPVIHDNKQESLSSNVA